MKVHSSSHGTYFCEYHIVWITKYRRRILKPGLQSYLKKLFSNKTRQMNGCRIIELNVLVDHIHLVVKIPPKYSVSDVVGEFKQESSHWLRKKFDWLKKVYWKEDVLWSPGYFVSTVGLNEQQIIEYVKYQQAQDSGRSKIDLK
jgi:putative transposase